MTKINTNNQSFIPKELATAAAGVTLSSASGVAMLYLTDTTAQLPEIVSNFLYYGSGAAAVAGVVMTIYSAVMLCKAIGEEGGLKNAITSAALGVGITALTRTLAEHFWEIAPYFWDLKGSSIAYAIATNFAWQAFAITGIVALIVTAYAAYRVGVSVLAQQPAKA